jgi:GDP/UDP-N,N'-diacetylbacillosamine 2-epimerase (hydrolysing)
MRWVGIITGCRSDYGLLYPLYKELQYICNPRFISVGPNNSLKHHADLNACHYKVETMLDSNTTEGIAKSIGMTTLCMAQFFEREKFDLLIILGDRWESFAAATAAHVFQIPIMHLHAGEETTGSLDNAWRHSISQMATYHGAPTKKAVGVLTWAIGENQNIRFVGGIGLHDIDLVEPSNEYDVIISMHPEAINPTGLNSHKIWKAICRESPETLRRSAVLARILITTESPDVNFKYDTQVGNVDRDVYLSHLKSAKMIIGNSSSGIIEAPALKTPTINIGQRQDGRPMSNSVFQANNVDEIMECVDVISDTDINLIFDNYYGNNAVKKTVDWVKEIFS